MICVNNYLQCTFFLCEGQWHEVRCCDLYQVSQCQDQLSEGLGLSAGEQTGGFTAFSVEDEEELIRHCT